MNQTILDWLPSPSLQSLKRAFDYRVGWYMKKFPKYL